MIYDKKHYREYTDAVVILTMVVAAYFAYHYLKTCKKIPTRATRVSTSLENYHEYVGR